MWVAVTKVDRTERITNTEVSGAPLPALVITEDILRSQPAKCSNVTTTSGRERGQGGVTEAL